MKQLLVSALLVALTSVTAYPGEIDVGGFTGPAPDGFMYVLLQGIWQLVASI